MDTEFLDRFGYYVVCGQKYYNKLEAFNVAFKQGYYPHWYFHESTFDKINWKQEPEKSLRQLYKERALALREKYDIIILSYSGGADSSTVAETFLHNGIKLDYLFNRSVVESVRRRDLEKDEANLHSETLHVAWPQFQEYKKIQPDLELIVYNYAQQMMDFWDQSGEIDPYSTNNYAPSLGFKQNITHYFKNKFPNKKVCFLHSIDKPIVYFKDNTFQLCFMDQFFLQQVPDTKKLWDQNINMETFFWSPDAADILCKQAHEIKKYFLANPDQIKIISNFPSRCSSNFWRKLMNNLIYDPVKNTLWQVNKADNRWQLSSYYFMLDNDFSSTSKYLNFYASYESEVRLIFKDADASFMYRDNFFDGLPSCFSKFYDIGA